MGRETGATRKRFALASLVAVAFAAFVAAAPASAGTLDQQQIEGGVPVEVFTCTSACGDFPQDYEQYAWAQTFTAGLTGLLDQVDLRLSRHESSTAPLTVETAPSRQTAARRSRSSQVRKSQRQMFLRTALDGSPLASGTQHL